jgi:hypothetical protein
VISSSGYSKTRQKEVLYKPRMGWRKERGIKKTSRGGEKREKNSGMTGRGSTGFSPGDGGDQHRQNIQ